MTEAENSTPTASKPKEPLGMFGLLMAKDGLQFALDHLVNAGKLIKASKVRGAESAEREVRVGANRVRRALDVVTRAIEKGVRPKEPPKKPGVVEPKDINALAAKLRRRDGTQGC